MNKLLHPLRTGSLTKIPMINDLKLKVCYIHLVLDEFDQETTELNPDKLNMISPTELSQYYIKDWQLKYFNSGTIPM